MDYRVGDVIEYSPFGGRRRKVKVTNREENIKNGRPGFDGETLEEDGQPPRTFRLPSGEVTGGECWGYDDQIIRVEDKTLDCGCVIFSAGSFKFCPTHAAAPALLSALEKIYNESRDPNIERIARAAILAAKGDKNLPDHNSTPNGCEDGCPACEVEG